MARGLSSLQRAILVRAASGSGIRPRDIATDPTLYPDGATMAARTAASRSLQRLRRRGLLIRPPAPPAVLSPTGEQVASLLRGTDGPAA